MSESRARPSTFRVLGIDPAAAGPTGYGVVESDGRRCRTLHYGALKVADKIRKESAGAALEAVNSLIFGFLQEVSPVSMGVAFLFSAVNGKTALPLAVCGGVGLLCAGH